MRLLSNRGLKVLPGKTIDDRVVCGILHQLPYWYRIHLLVWSNVGHEDQYREPDYGYAEATCSDLELPFL